jgi:Fuc2NAc and GlcNAc transferase
MDALTFALAGIVALVATGLTLRYARHRLLDQVNERSSHRMPTPRGGGLGLVLGIAVAWSISLFVTETWSIAAGSVLVGVFILTGLGWWDDHVGLSARARLPFQLLVSALAVWAIGVPSLLMISDWSIEAQPWLLITVALFCTAWLINLTNFMDGIDGIAGGQGVIAGIAGSLLALPPWNSLGLAIAGACLGFLWWNRPPARIFMGDVGSTTLGLVFAVLVLVQVRSGVAIEVALLPMAPFVLDATCTLVRRIWRHERLSQAHRSHLYQRLTRHWGAHLPVTCLYSGLALLGAMGAWGVQHGWFGSTAAVLLVVGIFAGLSIYGRRWAPA